ncbi:uncharacterized protein LOC108650332 [Drosophila navojoa]|uniref:uncharacterized protein LOC108650332 n=1 Tax=Drosophila navojoa TaxID=7232 RepID=UPI0008462A4D|nr:uncharacterized protein LOC108650332 [Drosophila navojoa]
MKVLTECTIGIILLTCACKVQDGGGSTVLFQSGECKFNPKFFDNFTIRTVNNTVNLEMVTKRSFDRGFNVHVDFSIKMSKADRYQRVFAHTMDACAVTMALKKNIFKAWFQSMLAHGNFIYHCPVPPDHYYLRNWKVDPKLVPQYLNAGSYRVTGHFFYGKLKSKYEDPVLDIIVYTLLKVK